MGGAIFNHGGDLVIVNSTLTGNTAAGGRSGNGTTPSNEGKGGAGFGGAVFNLNGALTVRYSTLAGNVATGGGGGGGSGTGAGGAIYSFAYNGAASTGSTSAALAIENSIVSNSTGLYDLVVDKPDAAIGPLPNVSSATTVATGGNVVMTSFAAGLAPALPAFTSTADPQLAPLADNGGPTPTRALGAASPAIDAASGACAPATDQRGYGRVAGAAADLGAYEFNAVESDVLFASGFESGAGCP